MLIAGVVVLIYLALLWAIVWFSLYPIRIPLFFAPGAMGLPQEDVVVETHDGLKLRGWWLEVTSGNGTDVAIFFHGYIMNRSEMAPHAYLLAQHGIHCLLVDLPAHGRSPKRRCGLGLTERHDVRSCVNWVQKRVPGAKVLLVGSSMGSAASAFAAAENPDGIVGLALDSPYDQMSEAILGWWNFLGGRWLVALLSPTALFAAIILRVNPRRIRVSDALAKAKLPTLILHGDSDKLASPEGARRNAEACGARLELFERCNHSEGRWNYPMRYNQALTDFAREVFNRPAE